MSAAYIWGVIAAMAFANFAVRFPPLAVLSKLALPEWLRRWLSFVPVSVMATLVVGEVARPDGQWLNPLGNPFLWAAAVTGLVYWRSRSFLGATVIGIMAFLVFRAVLG